jgi:hypothetical protein
MQRTRATKRLGVFRFCGVARGADRGRWAVQGGGMLRSGGSAQALGPCRTRRRCSVCATRLRPWPRPAVRRFPPGPPWRQACKVPSRVWPRCPVRPRFEFGRCGWPAGVFWPVAGAASSPAPLPNPALKRTRVVLLVSVARLSRPRRLARSLGIRFTPRLCLAFLATGNYGEIYETNFCRNNVSSLGI